MDNRVSTNVRHLSVSREAQRSAPSRHFEAQRHSSLDTPSPRNLTLTRDRRNFEPSSVAISRHIPRSVSDLRGSASRSWPQGHQRGSTQSPGRWKKVAAGARQPETARGHSRQPALNDLADHCSASSGSTAPDHTTDGLVTPTCAFHAS
jgi:hypothetical protein